MQSSEIEQYIIAHTEPESQLLADINRQTHLLTVYPQQLSGHVQGRFLAMISKMIRPRNILEIGTFTGYSALCLAEGLAEGGQLHTLEADEEIARLAARHFALAPACEAIHLHTGDAKALIPDLNLTFDLVFIDADKINYLHYYELVFDKVASGGYILADNVLWYEKVIQSADKQDIYTRSIVEFNRFVANDQRVEKVMLPLRDGLLLIRKKN